MSSWLETVAYVVVVDIREKVLNVLVERYEAIEKHKPARATGL